MLSVHSLILVCCLSVVLGQEAVTFIALGDWGDIILETPRTVANAMGRWSEKHGTTFIVSTGDNFYPWGAFSVDDEQFDEKWRYIYNHTAIGNLPWYMSVGNHDYGFGDRNEWFQVDFGDIEPRWVFPHLWHSFYKEAGSTKVHFVVIDTEAFRNRVNNYTDMFDWMEEELSNSEGDWKIVIGHRPIFSSGNYGPVSNSNYQTIRPILERYNVDLFLVGHDHNLQHLHKFDPNHDVDYIISGAGGAFPYEYDPDAERQLEENYGVKLAHFSEVWGFVGFSITKNEMYVEFVDEFDDIPYNFTRTK